MNLSDIGFLIRVRGRDFLLVFFCRYIFLPLVIFTQIKKQKYYFWNGNKTVLPQIL